MRSPGITKLPVIWVSCAFFSSSPASPSISKGSGFLDGPLASFLLEVVFFLLILILIPQLAFNPVYLSFYDFHILFVELEGSLYWKIDQFLIRYN